MAVAAIPLKPGQAQLVGQIIKNLEQGDIGSFIQPWVGVGMAPKNAISMKSYTGYNRFATTIEAFTKGYKSPLWLTRKQIESRGGTLPEEARPTHVVFTGRYRRKAASPEAGTVAPPENAPGDAQSPPPPPPKPEPAPVAVEATPETSPKQVDLLAMPAAASEPVLEWGRFVREYAVYNLDQSTGVRLPKKTQAWLAEREAKLKQWTPQEGLERMRGVVNNANICPIRHVPGNLCAYAHGSHTIISPLPEQFPSELDMLEAHLHEIVHASGAKHLLNRPTLVAAKGADSEDYAVEEITAVMGSLFISQDCGVPPTKERERNWSSYLSGYNALGFLEKKPSIFIRALVNADFASNFIQYPEKRPEFIANRKAPNQIEFDLFPSKATIIEPASPLADKETDLALARRRLTDMEKTANLSVTAA
jgi:antirestriction protein ArdC